MINVQSKEFGLLPKKIFNTFKERTLSQNFP